MAAVAPGGSAAPDGVGAYVPPVLADWLRDAPTARWKELDATLVFVDISGFTRLSERLARAGNIGAEELTDTIDRCFADLLRVAYAGGGSLLKFGGDALLLLYVDEGHAARGCRSAVGMRHALRDLGRLETSAGSVALQMSIGIHSGPIHLFLAGRSHREMVVTGPGSTETVTMEAAADAGQIIVSPSTAARLDASVVGPVAGPGLLLQSAPSSDDPGGPRAAHEPTSVSGPPEEVLALHQALPLALRNHLAAERRDAEHRRVTIAFLKFRGADELIRTEGAGAAAEALDAIIQVVQEGVDRHDVTFLGTDIDADGGKVLLASGAPVSGGNDEERMLLALRDIVERPSRLALQIGVHAGHVFAGDVGPAYRRAYTVMGDAVNLAARVMGRSIPRAILATDEVLAPSRTTFVVDRLDPFAVKGKSKPVLASRVGPVVGTRSKATASTLPFVGRHEELGAFDAVVGRTADGSGQLVDVVGEPGIGKSRLLAAFRTRTTDRPVVELVCELHRASVPYGATRKLLRALLGAPPEASAGEAAQHLLRVLRDEVPHLLEWAPLLAIAYGTELPATTATENLDDQFLRPRLHEVVIELLRWAWQGPVLVTVEDAQWMDEASADVLRAVAAQLDQRPWVLCTTRREQDPRPAEEAPTTTLRLAPLDPTAASELARAATDAAPLPPHETALIIERSGGNPLFLQELVAAAHDAGGIDALPSSIESLMTSRIDRLPAASRRVLCEVSVLGYSFPRELAAEVLTSGDPAELTQLPAFLSLEGELVRFRHAMIRDAAYAGLPYRRRRKLHAIVGDTIAASGSGRQELLSFHYHLAARYEDAWHASLAAGTAAAALYANDEAATFYRRALDDAPRIGHLDPVEVARVSEALGDALLRLGQLAEAGDAYRAAGRARRHDVVAGARVLLKGARVKAQLNRYSQALADITRGLSRIDDQEGLDVRAQRAQLMVWYGHLRLEQGRPDDAIHWCRRTIEEAEVAGDRDALGHAYRLLDWAYADRGQPELAVYSARAISLYEELGDLPNQASVLNNLGGFAYWAGNWAEALELYRRANDLDEQVGDVIGAALGRNNIAEILTDQGGWVEAEELFRDAERALRAAGFRSALPLVRINLGRTAARIGHFDEAEELLETAREGAREVGAATEVLEADARLAELHVMRARPRDALSILEGALQRSDAKEGVAAQEPLLYRVRGYAQLQLGDFAAARSSLEQSLAAARARDADYERALAQRALSDLAAVSGVGADQRLSAASSKTLDALGVERLPEVPLTIAIV
jgi:class 3 adenylate cyclase/tetratricopeptide (TPR) repeat protein